MVFDLLTYTTRLENQHVERVLSSDVCLVSACIKNTTTEVDLSYSVMHAMYLSLWFGIWDIETVLTRRFAYNLMINGLRSISLEMKGGQGNKL